MRSTADRGVLARLVQHVDQFQLRALQDALSDAMPDQLERRARAFDAVGTTEAAIIAANFRIRAQSWRTTGGEPWQLTRRERWVADNLLGWTPTVPPELDPTYETTNDLIARHGKILDALDDLLGLEQAA